MPWVGQLHGDIPTGGAQNQLRTVGMRRFDKHLQRSARQAGVVAVPQGRFEHREPIHTLVFDWRRHLIGHRRRRRASAATERKNVDLRESDFLGDSTRRHEIVFGLARKADDDVGRERGPIKRLPDQPAALDKVPDAPPPLHPPQHRVRAALQADMQMRTDFVGVLGHRGDQFARHLGRLDTRQPDAEIARQPRDPIDQVGQPQPLGLRLVPIAIDAVVPQMNAREDDFPEAVVDQPPHLVEDMLGRTAGHVRTNIGNDAVTAAKQTAVLHFDVSSMAVGQAADTRGHVADTEAAEPIGQFAFIGHHVGNAG